MLSLTPVRNIIFAFALLLPLACKNSKPSPQGSSSATPQPAASSSVTPATPPTIGVDASTANHVTTAAAPQAKPTPLDEAGQRTARAYLSALARGRKATVAKDYAAADDQFTKCLDLLPKDPRALAERGYARLLAGQLQEAKNDLTAAEHSAPNSMLKRQIVHNLMLVARKQGDDRAAQRWETEKKRIDEARRVVGDIECTLEVNSSDLEPMVVEDFDAALKRIIAEHARADGCTEKEVSLESPRDFETNEEQKRITTLAARHPFPDGGTVVWTRGSAGYRNHAVIAQAGKFYVYPNLSVGGMALCGLDGLAEVSIEGGGTTPMRILVSRVSLVRGYMCAESNGDCSAKGAQTMGFCAWSSSDTAVTILDAKTFHGIRTLDASAAPKAEEGRAPDPLMDLEWQSDHVIVEACGQRKRVPFVEQ